MEKMQRLDAKHRTITGKDTTDTSAPSQGAAVFQLNMNKISGSIKAIRERLTSLEQNLEQLKLSHEQGMNEVKQLQQQVTYLHTISEKLECLTSHTEQLTTLSSMCEELQSITQLTQEVNNIREGLTALDNVVYKDD